VKVCTTQCEIIVLSTFGDLLLHRVYKLPTELEAHILLLDQVAECAVFPVNDAIAGERPKAAVVWSNLGSKVSDRNIAGFVAKHVESHKAHHKCG
jgi:acyl-coenzyme A synthetase/AMP-(fatty) acid ligase